MNEREIVQVEAGRILVGCSANATQLPIDPTKRLREQISSAVFAHERQCGQCDLTYAYGRGSPDFDRNAARQIQEQIDAKRKGPPA